MSGWLYLIKNGYLYKIGITKNLKIRMKQLKPDILIAKIYSKNFRQLERTFHKRFKDVRIPQTEYFRLDQFQIREIENKIKKFSYPENIKLLIIIKSFFSISLLFLFVIIFISLHVNNMNEVLIVSLLWMERISISLSLFSLFFNSGRYLASVMN
tara:strand:+ start:1272 stop:1736 length:465 start_codon:yes stop_codon:yes gene_type:complete